MEIFGRKLNFNLLGKSLRFLKRGTDRVQFDPRRPLLSTKKQLLCSCSNRPTLLSSDYSNSLLRKRYFNVSTARSAGSEDSEDPYKKGKFKEILENDLELQNIMKDIMLDFNDNNPPNHPSNSKKSFDDKNDEPVNSKPCDSCGTAHKDMPHSIEGNFKVFDDSQTEEILDYSEEQQQKGSFYLYQEKENPLQKYEFKRGMEGVFDIEELVTVLQQENVSNLVVVAVPQHLHYCDYLVFISAKSQRHLKALNEFIKKLYKQKKEKSDAFIVTEGKDCTDWKVLDMGNIVLHLFLEDTRSHYDLETLWTVGEQYDDLSNLKEDQVLDLLQQHIMYLDEIETLPVEKRQSIVPT